MAPPWFRTTPTDLEQHPQAPDIDEAAGVELDHQATVERTVPPDREQLRVPVRRGQQIEVCDGRYPAQTLGVRDLGLLEHAAVDLAHRPIASAPQRPTAQWVARTADTGR
jgi:hypothetical protein